MLGSGAPTPGWGRNDNEALQLALGLLASLGNPAAHKKAVEDLHKLTETAHKEHANAQASIKELQAKRSEHEARERELGVRADNAGKVEQELALRKKELRDLADQAVADRQRAAQELQRANEAAKEIIHAADTKAHAAEDAAKGALAHKLQVEKEEADLQKKIASHKAELKALVGKLTG